MKGPTLFIFSISRILAPTLFSGYIAHRRCHRLALYAETFGGFPPLDPPSPRALSFGAAASQPAQALACRVYNTFSDSVRGRGARRRVRARGTRDRLKTSAHPRRRAAPRPPAKPARAPALHRLCISSASALALHPPCIGSASALHRPCIRPASALHRP